MATQAPAPSQPAARPAAAPVDDRTDEQKAADRARDEGLKAQAAAADPESKFKDGEYEVLQPIVHDNKPYAVGSKVKVTAKQAEQLAAVGAIKV